MHKADPIGPSDSLARLYSTLLPIHVSLYGIFLFSCGVFYFYLDYCKKQQQKKKKKKFTAHRK
jgi:hypothetical protein